MVVRQRGWEHNAYQSDNQFIVEAKRVVEDPEQIGSGAKVGYPKGFRQHQLPEW